MMCSVKPREKLPPCFHPNLPRQTSKRISHLNCTTQRRQVHPWTFAQQPCKVESARVVFMQEKNLLLLSITPPFRQTLMWAIMHQDDCSCVPVQKQKWCPVFLKFTPRTSNHLNSSTRGTLKLIFESTGEFGSGQGQENEEEETLIKANPNPNPNPNPNEENHGYTLHWMNRTDEAGKKRKIKNAALWVLEIFLWFINFCMAGCARCD